MRKHCAMEAYICGGNAPRILDVGSEVHYCFVYHRSYIDLGKSRIWRFLLIRRCIKLIGQLTTRPCSWVAVSLHNTFLFSCLAWQTKRLPSVLCIASFALYINIIHMIDCVRYWGMSGPHLLCS